MMWSVLMAMACATKDAEPEPTDSASSGVESDDSASSSNCFEGMPSGAASHIENKIAWSGVQSFIINGEHRPEPHSVVPGNAQPFSRQ